MAIKKFLFVNTDGFYEEGYVEGTIATRACDSSLAVGDLVCESSSITDGVDKVTSNSETRDVVGWVMNKPSSTTAEILFKGVITGLSGLTKTGKVYLSDTGGFTSTLPTSNYVKVLGHAIDADQIDFNPVNTKIKRV
jgi:hypothetical protein